MSFLIDAYRFGSTPPVIPSAFFASDPMLSAGWHTVSGPSGFYESGADKTYVAWQYVGLSGYKGVHAAAYDHAAGTWGERYTVGNFLLANDDHGHPALVRDADGYIHCFYGAHNNALKWSSTNSVDDISAWTQHADIASSTTYPKPVLVGSAIWLFFRDGTTAGNLKLAVSTMTPTAGVGTFSALTNLVDFGASTRVYTTEMHLIGTDIHFCCMYANSPDSFRENVYYYVLDTTTGDISNFDGSVTITAGSRPVTLAQSNADFKIFDHGTNDGDVPSLQFDTSGNAHVIFADGTTPTYDLKHMFLSGGSWSTPATIATLTDIEPGSGYVGTYNLVPGASGVMEAWYNLSGDKTRRVRSSGGAWAAAETISVAGTYDFVDGAAIKNADPDMRTLYAEWSGTNTDSAAANLGLFAYGDSGPMNDPIDMSAVDPAGFDNVVLLEGGNSRNTSVRFIDESPSALIPTVGGNAQISTAQFKFGSGSILLDGTGDYLEYPNNAIWDIGSNAYVMECFIRPATVSSLRTIFARREASGNATGWSFYTSATGQVGFIGYSSPNVLCINIASAASLLALNTWAHVAVERDASGNWRLLHEGSVVAGPTAESATIAGNSRPMQIGRQASNTARDFNGYLDEVRITRGASRYLGSYTVPTAAFPRR